MKDTLRGHRCFHTATRLSQIQIKNPSENSTKVARLNARLIARLAQWLEHQSYELRVVGSTPTLCITKAHAFTELSKLVKKIDNPFHPATPKFKTF